MNAEELAIIKERADNAPPAPWTFGEGYEQMSPGYYIADGRGRIAFADEEYTVKPETIEFIVNARQDVPKLVAEVTRLRKALEFYADQGNYGADVHYNGGEEPIYWKSIVENDEGEIAMEALK